MDAEAKTDFPASFDPFSEAYLADPYKVFAQARAAAPVFYSPALDHWVVTRYREVRQVFETPALFSASNALSSIREVCPAAQAILRDGGFASVPILTNNDPPGHTRVRRLANVAFKPRRVAAMEPFVRELVTRFSREHLAGGKADLIRDFAWEVPALVIFRMLGIPDDHVARVKTGAHSRMLFMFGRPDDQQQCELARGMAAFWRYAAELVAARAAEPREDFTSDLLAARDGELAALSHAEVTTIVYGLLLAGHETTTNMLGNAFLRLLSNRDAWEAICREPALIPNAIEEVLRFDSSVIAWRRRAIREAEVGGVQIPAEAKLLLMIGSANRDPEVFAGPERFDIYRANAREHLAFGHGNHFCLGATLARLEAKVVLEEFTGRFPNLHLLPDQDLRFSPNISFRGPLSLLARWD